MTQEIQAIARLKQGDIDGLEYLVQCYQVQALRAAYLVTHDYAMAEDTVQATFLQVYERIGQFDSSRAFGPWFLRSVVNTAIKTVSKSNRHVPLDLADDVSLDVRTLEELAEKNETSLVLWETLTKLSPKQRASIVLRYYLDLSEDEMSNELNCPPGTVKRRLHDARKRLQSLLPAWFRQTIEEPQLKEVK